MILKNVLSQVKLLIRGIPIRNLLRTDPDSVGLQATCTRKFGRSSKGLGRRGFVDTQANFQFQRSFTKIRLQGKSQPR